MLELWASESDETGAFVFASLQSFNCTRQQLPGLLYHGLLILLAALRLAILRSLGRILWLLRIYDRHHTVARGSTVLACFFLGFSRIKFGCSSVG